MVLRDSRRKYQSLAAHLHCLNSFCGSVNLNVIPVLAGSAAGGKQRVGKCPRGNKAPLPVTSQNTWREFVWRFPSALWSHCFLYIPMTICIGLLLRKQSFQLESPLVLENSYEDLHLSILLKEISIRKTTFPINSFDDLHLSILLEEKFSSRISSFPVNSYDDLHLSTLLKEKISLGSHLFL